MISTICSQQFKWLLNSKLHTQQTRSLLSFADREKKKINEQIHTHTHTHTYPFFPYILDITLSIFAVDVMIRDVLFFFSDFLSPHCFLNSESVAVCDRVHRIIPHLFSQNHENNKEKRKKIIIRAPPSHTRDDLQVSKQKIFF